MSRPNTRPNNKDKHPGMVDLSPPRRTQTHKRVENERSTEEKLASEEARQTGIRHLAQVEERTSKTHKALMAGSGPRAVPQKMGPPAKKVKIAPSAQGDGSDHAGEDQVTRPTEVPC